MSAFFAGLRRVGPSEAAILSTFEPIVTVALALVVLGERLSEPQLAGGALVLAAVVLLQLRRAPANVNGGRVGRRWAGRRRSVRVRTRLPATRGAR